MPVKYSYPTLLIIIACLFSCTNSDQKKNAADLSVPEENRFVVEVLDTYMYEPMEMVIFNDGRILYVERRGDIKIYDPKTKKSKVIAKFDVSITGNYEDGILGVTLDPDLKRITGFILITHPQEMSRNRMCQDL
jgi:hypothetical protein